MSELTREKIYKNELEKVGGEGNNNLERIRSLDGAGALENITDKNGNLRFIEGTGTTSGEITSTYCKWSLSGTHIMFVCAGSKTEGTIISGLVFATFTVPDWILNKIVPTWVKTVETKSINFINSYDNTLSAGMFNLRKNNDKIDIQLKGDVTLSNKSYFRIQFDLLIDTE